jgi:hypothetical protein
MPGFENFSLHKKCFDYRCIIPQILIDRQNLKSLIYINAPCSWGLNQWVRVGFIRFHGVGSLTPLPALAGNIGQPTFPLRRENMKIAFFVIVFLLTWSFLSKQERQKEPIIAVKAVFDSNGRLYASQTLHLVIFRHFLAKELADLEEQIRKQTLWQKGEIRVEAWIVSQTPFVFSVSVFHGDEPLLTGALRVSDFQSDAAAAAFAAKDISQEIFLRALTHPKSLRPELRHAVLPAFPEAPHRHLGAHYF